MNQNQCPFCHLAESRVYLENDCAVAILDDFPVTVSHTLVIPKQHVVSLFELPEAEQAALWRLVALVRAKLLDELKPSGFNIGVNDGFAAGQTVMHAHVHVIPRRHGDVSDPKGGVRWIFPNKAAYWVEE